MAKNQSLPLTANDAGKQTTNIVIYNIKNSEMKKKKLNIDELKLESYLTELAPEISATAKGGEASSLPCATAVSTAYSVVAQNQSWFPYNGSSECKQTTTTTTTTTTKSGYIFV